jgi:hypothetical protein
MNSVEQLKVLVFKTNASSDTDRKEVELVLKQFKAIVEWNFNLDDCDRILRISTINETELEMLVAALDSIGIAATELED